MKKNVMVLIVDLDNTLYDWANIWYASFSAMLTRLARDSGISKNILKKEFKAIHQKYGSSEYAFAIEELPSLLKKHPHNEIREIYRDAIKAYADERKRTLHLYDDVFETLKFIKNKGSLIIGYTESMEFYTKMRIKSFRLDGVFDYVYTPQDHDIPSHIDLKNRRAFSDDYYELRYTKIKHTPKGEKKPNPKVLLDIIREVNADVQSVIYVGDSLVKDVLMAQQASVTDVLAKYGVAHKREEYELLREVTHWTPEEVRREKETEEKDVSASYVLKKSFAEILDFFDFKKFSKQEQNK